MADYISKYTGAQIDLAVASGSTPSGHITASGNVNVGGNISSSGKFYSDDEIHLRDGNSSGDTLVKMYASGDDGIIDVYQDNSSKARIHGNGKSYFKGGDVEFTGTILGATGEIKSITSALTLHATSSGMTVIPSGGARTITLPHVASGSGCTFRIIAGSAHQHIVTASNPNVGADNSLIYGHIMDNNNATSAAGAGGTVVAAADKITLNSNCQIGDSITIVGDGTNWYVSGLLKDAPTVA